MEKTDWMPGTIFSSVLVVAGWSYFIFTGNISTIWPMFGIANQLLAGIALCVGTTLIVNLGSRTSGMGHPASAIVRLDNNANRRVQEHYR
jgi:carbon starvation protein CstA